MPLISSRSSGSARAFGFSIRSALASILELFSRSDNASSLGSIRGQKWKIWRGAWQILSNKAFSNSPASNNSLATLKFTSSDVIVSVSGAEPGMGMSFWVTDADNWYASTYIQNEVCQTCSNCNSFSGGNCASFSGGNCNAWTCNSVVCSSSNCTSWVCNCFGCTGGPGTNPTLLAQGAPCNAWGCSSGCNSCVAWQCNSSFCAAASCAASNPSVCTSSNPVVCNAFFTFSCNCVVEHRINIFKSVASSIITLSNSLFSAAVQSFTAALSGNQITVSAYSNSSYSSQIGNSVIINESSPIKSSSHGIIKSTSSYSQGSSINEFKVN